MAEPAQDAQKIPQETIDAINRTYKRCAEEEAVIRKAHSDTKYADEFSTSSTSQTQIYGPLTYDKLWAMEKKPEAKSMPPVSKEQWRDLHRLYDRALKKTTHDMVKKLGMSKEDAEKQAPPLLDKDGRILLEIDLANGAVVRSYQGVVLSSRKIGDTFGPPDAPVVINKQLAEDAIFSIDTTMNLRPDTLPAQVEKYKFDFKIDADKKYVIPTDILDLFENDKPEPVNPLPPPPQLPVPPPVPVLNLPRAMQRAIEQAQALAPDFKSEFSSIVSIGGAKKIERV